VCGSCGLDAMFSVCMCMCLWNHGSAVVYARAECNSRVGFARLCTVVVRCLEVECESLEEAL
jgi:hypothetical protein